MFKNEFKDTKKSPYFKEYLEFSELSQEQQLFVKFKHVPEFDFSAHIFGVMHNGEVGFVATKIAGARGAPI